MQHEGELIEDDRDGRPRFRRVTRGQRDPSSTDRQDYGHPRVHASLFYRQGRVDRRVKRGDDKVIAEALRAA
jgi:hypothetical protein